MGGASPTGCCSRSARTRRRADALITLPGAPGGLRHRGRRPRGLRADVPAGRVPARGRARRGPAEPRGALRGRARRGHRPVVARALGRPEEHGQAKVEAASLALILDLTRPVALGPPRRRRAGARRRVPVVRRRRPRLPAQQLGLVPDRRRDVPAVGRRPVVGRRPRASDLAAHDSFARADGWFSDGDRARASTTTSAGRCTCTRRCGRGCRGGVGRAPTRRPGRRRRAWTATCRTRMPPGRRPTAPR